MVRIAFRLVFVSLVACWWLTLLAGASCDEAQPTRESAAPTRVRHAIRSEQIRDLMAKLQMQATRTWPQEIQDEMEASAERDAERRLQLAGRFASDLADAARQLPAAMEGHNLTPAEQEAYMAAVEELETESRDLARVAKAGDLDQTRAVLNRVENTCNKCHSQFRAFPAPVNIVD
jgi:cytochrome c556